MASRRRSTKFAWKQLTLVLLLLVHTSTGCAIRQTGSSGESLERYELLANRVEYPDVTTPVLDPSVTVEQPRTLTNTDHEPWNLTIEEAVQLALQHSTVLRDLGGQVLQTPAAVRTILGPSIQQTDPRLGVEAALAAFDAQVFASVTADRNDYISNNKFLAGGTNLLQQDLGTGRMQVSKKTATGTEFFMRNVYNYDFNNAPGNYDPNLPWTTFVEGEFRMPTLQGGGVDFNRIAGPNSTPGVYNGVVIARVNTDVAVTDFEMGLRDLVNNVENAYWDLYFAYRDLEAKLEGRDSALEIWDSLRKRSESGLPGNALGKEPQAREQYYRFAEEVQTALTGRVVFGTRSYGDVGGGTFRGSPGVQVAERRLRWILGIDINDGRMIVPATTPSVAPWEPSWGQVSSEALSRRVELRRQRLLVKRRELELLASRNFLLPRFDVVGRYRFRGTGHDLIGPPGPRDKSPDDGGTGAYIDNAFQNLTSGAFQEWRLGGEFSFPVGFRQGYSAVRSAELNLARERAILVEAERHVIHDLSNAFADVKRAQENCRLIFNRRVAAHKRLQQLNEGVEPGDSEKLETWLSDKLEALRRVVETDSSYQSALVEYALAVKNLHFEAGSLLDFNNVFLAEEIGHGQTAQRPPQGVDQPLDYRLPARASEPPVQELPVPEPAAN